MLAYTCSSSSTESAKDDDSDFSDGAGVNVGPSEEVFGNVEYIRYVDTDDATVDGISLGLALHF